MRKSIIQSNQNRVIDYWLISIAWILITCVNIAVDNWRMDILERGKQNWTTIRTNSNRWWERRGGNGGLTSLLTDSRPLASGGSWPCAWVLVASRRTLNEAMACNLFALSSTWPAYQWVQWSHKILSFLPIDFHTPWLKCKSFEQQ